jgi:outer membrane receptor protein involved in Fe transport
MRGRTPLLLLLLIMVSAGTALATVFGTVRGIVHDSMHRPIQGAKITLHARQSDWSREATTDAEGQFLIDAVPAGEYTVHIAHSGFLPVDQAIVVATGSAPVLHFPMQLEGVKEKVTVEGTPDVISPEASSARALVTEKQIDQTPGASRANSLALITNEVPGATIVHNQLHLRGGHQVTWLVDGVPVPNTNIATTVGPQFDPKDIATLEIQRGGYSAEYGDRTYAVFDIVPRSGFERNREAEIRTSFGSPYETNNQLSFGSHTQRFAYYASLNGSRANLGLETPTPATIHDLADGFGGFASLFFNATPSDQLRLVTSARADHFQVPNTPDQQFDGVRNIQNERDAFANFSWVHTASSGVLLTVSPFYHFSRASFDGGPNDPGFQAIDHQASHYAGGQVSLSVVRGRHNARGGFYAFAQHDNRFFGVTATDGSGQTFSQRQLSNGNLEAFFLEDQFKLTKWLTLNGGVRLTHFSGAITENAASPRVGAAIRVPRLNWVLRGFYGRYYQAPPLSTVSGPLLQFALNQGFSFLPLHGERNEQQEFGLTIPFRGWVFDGNYFRTTARNFFDHDVLGNSNLFFPLTIDHARIRGWEASIRSPRTAGRAQFHLNYSHQYTEGQGGVSGGLTDFTPPDPGYFFLDHDQRDTLNAGVHVQLPWQSWFSANLAYGSGFLQGDGPAHLPRHATLDFSLGKSFGEKWRLSFTALNLFNRRYQIDESNSFGGTHWNNPHQFSFELRYRFHY